MFAFQCSLISAYPCLILNALWFRKSCISLFPELLAFQLISMSNAFNLFCTLVCGLASSSAADSGLRLHFAHTWVSTSLPTPILRHSCYHRVLRTFRQWLRSEFPPRRLSSFLHGDFRLAALRYHQGSEIDTIFNQSEGTSSEEKGLSEGVVSVSVIA